MSINKYIFIFCLILPFPWKLFGLVPSDRIRLNQVGFYVHAPKIAVITGEVAADHFYILRADLKDTLFCGRLCPQKQSAYSSTITRIADFTALHTKGHYVLSVPGVGTSYPFVVSNKVHHSLALASLKAFYFQRASMSLEPAYAGKWSRPSGHPDTVVYIHPSAATAQRPPGTIISCPGGWYDAGDYNKYIVNSGITMGTLLSAYEDFPFYFDTLHIDIPESSDAVPDILNETIYNLRWMFTMQDPFDGGVYHKCTNASFDAMIMPAACKTPRYVVQKSTAATLDFAAVMAQASRIFKKFSKQLPGLSDSCLLAAQHAWQWASSHPTVKYDQDAMNSRYEPKITTGAYGDQQFDDEWFWAACELLVTTKNRIYMPAIIERWNDKTSLPSWANVRILGYYTLIRCQTMLPPAVHLPVGELRDRMLDFANSMMTHGGNNAFQTIMGQSNHDFIWGSNSVAANEGIVLINAFLLTKNKKYMDSALSNLDYLMGRNATGYCFVTGFGSKSPLHPHHRPSVADGINDPVPGLLVGGPNPGRQDHCHYDFFEPETAYTDSDCAYASNEVAINWNAPLVYLAGAVEALQRAAGYTK